MSQIWIQPLVDKSSDLYGYCTEPLQWGHLRTDGGTAASIHHCNPLTSNKVFPYRFCVSVKGENYPSDLTTQSGSSSGHGLSLHPIWNQPAHTITLVSPITLVNLLPCELHYEVKRLRLVGRIKRGKESCIHSADIDEQLEFLFHIENFLKSNRVVVPVGKVNFVARLRLYDSLERLLLLQVKVLPQPGGALKLLVSSPYWIINRTGLPLMFRQEGASQAAAGQFEEHEMARIATPMLFSFDDQDISTTLIARVGTGVHADGKPQWSHPFHLRKGVRVQRLRVSPQDSRPDWVYVIGIAVDAGHGRYRDTNMVVVSPRFQLHNQSQHNLQFSQKCFTASDSDAGSEATYLQAVPQCHLPFHWPRLDKDQLLCVRLQDIPNCHWSGGFKIEAIDSFHINIRDAHGHSYFIRVEIVLQRATYFIAFVDADTMPPPLRIDNFSEVPIIYYQTSVTEEHLQTTVRPLSSVPYAWDEPILPPHITCVAPGGSSATYNMNVLEEGSQLTYENFIYVSFTGTFQRVHLEDFVTPADNEAQQLVLDVLEGTRVIISKKEPGRRSQLWRMTGAGMLQHEGSSPPQDPKKPQTDPSRTLVLDIAGPAPQPMEYVPLMLRKPDYRRKLTQTWRFTKDGRLCCEHSNMYVQAKDGFGGLRPGNDVVLGPPQHVCFGRMENGVPVEQAISRQRLRPGSGFLSVTVATDGPTRVLQIADIKQKKMYAKVEDRDWVYVSKAKPPTLIYPEGEKAASCERREQELQVVVTLHYGLGLSVVSTRPLQELLYARFSNIKFQYTGTASQHTFDGSIQNIQVDNQAFECVCPVVLYVTPSSNTDNRRHLPAIYFTIHKVPNKGLNAEIFKHCIIAVKNLTLNIEEKMLFGLLDFAGYNESDLELEKLESNYGGGKIVTAASNVYTKRYYFGMLQFALNQVRLSVLTSPKLPPDLLAIKRKLGLRLMKFEDANIELNPFIKVHPFETSQFLRECFMKHYKDEMKSRAAFIVGSTDVIGNPMGFVNDVSEGVSDLLSEGSVTGFVKNVTHGLSNSAAKVTGSMSEGLGRVTLDEQYEDHRRRIWQEHMSRGNYHFLAGIKGLTYGILGGVTGIITKPYEGAAAEGLQGFISGIGKGVVGTLTKPAVGLLDLATGAASAVRDSSRNTKKFVPVRMRPVRLLVGSGGLLPPFSEKQARGQAFLYEHNDRNYRELFVAYECLRQQPKDLRILISTEQVQLLSVDQTSECSVVIHLTVHLSDLFHCKPIVEEPAESESEKYLIELTIRADTARGVSVTSEEARKRPQVRCDSEAIARKVAQQINYAKNMYEEMRHAVVSDQEHA